MSKQEKLDRYTEYIDRLHNLRMSVVTLQTITGDSGSLDGSASITFHNALIDTENALASEIKQKLYEKHSLERYE